MSGAPKLSLADQALANVLGFLAVQTLEDSRTQLALDELRALIPAANTMIPAVARLASAGLEVMAVAPYRRDRAYGADWSRAMLAARAASADFLFWRGGMALDALRAAMAEKGAA